MSGSESTNEVGVDTAMQDTDTAAELDTVVVANTAVELDMRGGVGTAAVGMVVAELDMVAERN